MCPDDDQILHIPLIEEVGGYIGETKPRPEGEIDYAFFLSTVSKNNNHPGLAMSYVRSGENNTQPFSWPLSGESP